MTSKYLFDTYAIMAILKGSLNYSSYKDADIVINNFVFAELCYNLFRIKESKAKEYINEYSQFINSVKPEWIEEAMQFRVKWKDREVTITDCVSYIMAKSLGIKFLTGDKEFEGMEGVEFVKEF